MSKFTQILVVSPYSDGKTWYLRTEFGFDWTSKNNTRTITVPVGFSTDFASIPRLFWTVLPKWGKYGNAAVIHDYLYFVQKDITRKEADVALLDGMRVLNVVFWQKFAIYYAVRWFGFCAWYLNQRKKLAGYSKIALKSPTKSSDEASHWRIGKREWVRILLKKGYVRTTEQGSSEVP